METILKYFPDLDDTQIERLQALDDLYREWNAMINVISRKDIDNLFVHHVLHSLAIAKFLKFRPGAAVLDLGTGGGFPGIPLAIVFPETLFTLVDSTQKKIKVVSEISRSLDLKNVKAQSLRAESLTMKFDFVVTRGVADLDQLTRWCAHLFSHVEQHAYPNGLIALKGGKLREEISVLPKGSYSETIPISKYFKEPFFEEKFIVYVQA